MNQTPVGMEAPSVPVDAEYEKAVKQLFTIVKDMDDVVLILQDALFGNLSNLERESVAEWRSDQGKVCAHVKDGEVCYTAVVYSPGEGALCVKNRILMAVGSLRRIHEGLVRIHDEVNSKLGSLTL